MPKKTPTPIPSDWRTHWVDAWKPERTAIAASCLDCRHEFAIAVWPQDLERGADIIQDIMRLGGMHACGYGPYTFTLDLEPVKGEDIRDADFSEFW